MSSSASKIASKGGPRRRLPAAARRELIVAAALDEVGERGYEAASMGRIAAASGVSRTVLYDHFPSKLALFAELLRVEHAELLGYLREAFDSGRSTEERWRAAFDAFFRWAEMRPRGASLLYPTRPPLDPEAAREHASLRAESNRVMASLLAADARRAGLEPESVRARAVFYMHRNALQAGVRWWRTHPDVTREELVDAALAALWTGFGGMQPPPG